MEQEKMSTDARAITVHWGIITTGRVMGEAKVLNIQAGKIFKTLIYEEYQIKAPGDIEEIFLKNKRENRKVIKNWPIFLYKRSDIFVISAIPMEIPFFSPQRPQPQHIILFKNYPYKGIKKFFKDISAREERKAKRPGFNHWAHNLHRPSHRCCNWRLKCPTRGQRKTTRNIGSSQSNGISIHFRRGILRLYR